MLAHWLTSLSYEKFIKKIQRLEGKAEAPTIKTTQLQQALAQLEATLSRKENQKVRRRLKKHSHVTRSFKLIILIYVS